MNERRPEIDWLKSISICVVVLIHALRSPFDPNASPTEHFLAHLTRFAVPGFLAASGFLYATRDRIPWQLTLRRLRRILVPYLVATLAAQIFWAAQGAGPRSGELWRDVFLAASFGPYYYVLQALLVVLLAPLLARIGKLGIWLLLPVAVGAQWVYETASLGLWPFFYHLRNPALWMGYFLAGWCLRLYGDRVGEWIGRHRLWLLGAAASAVAALGILNSRPGAFVQTQTVAWLGVWATLALIYFGSVNRRPPPAPVRYLSDLTYSIFLFHMFFVLPAARMIVPPPQTFDVIDIGLRWLPGMVAPIVLVEIARRTIGTRSRTWLGA